MHNKTKLSISLAVIVITVITYLVITENTYSTNMRLGDSASKCAAIYASKEASFLGQSLEFLMLINPIDESEDELSKKIRAFHTLAVEYYISANESAESAKYLADYSIMHYTKEIKDGDDTNTIESTINESSCNATLEEIKAITNNSA